MDLHSGTAHTPSASEKLLRLAPPKCPEDRLMLAVLLDAVALLREQATGLHPHPRRLVVTTARWLAADDEGWPLSFVNVCRTLGFDPEGLRADLRAELAELGARALLDPQRSSVVPLPVLEAVVPSVRRRRHATPFRD